MKIPGIDLDAAALDPPPGAIQDLDNPPNGNNIIIGLYSAGILVATIFVFLRLYTKFVFLKPQIQDYLLIPTYGVFLAHCAFWIKINDTTGNFVHMWNFRVGGLAPFYENGFYGTLFYEAVMLAIKPIILLEWIDIFASAGPRNAFNWTCYTLGAINIIVYLVSILIDAASCTPREYWWDKTIEGYCANTRDLPIATAIINVIIDVFILVLPQGIIWKLNMSKNKRIGVSIVFLFGLISVGAAITRLALSVTYASSEDVTYQFSEVGPLLLLEMIAAILVFTAPAVPKPVVHFAKEVNSSVRSLLRSQSGGDRSYAIGSMEGKNKSYQELYEARNGLSAMKFRSSKKSLQARNSGGDEDGIEMGSSRVPSAASHV